MQLHKSNQFCHDLLRFDTKYAKVLSNIVMALSSYESSMSVIGLSESPIFWYQYSSISDISAYLSANFKDNKSLQASVRSHLEAYYPYSDWSKQGIRLQTDVTSLIKRHSECLSERQYVYVPNNLIAKNKPLDVGYGMSSTHISLDDGWSLPVVVKRLGISDNACQVGVEGLQALMLENPFKEAPLVRHTADRYYGQAAFLSPLHSIDNLVNIVALRHGSKIWTPALPKRAKTDSIGVQGAPCIFGDCFYLIEKTQVKTYKRKEQSYQVEQRSIFDHKADEMLVFEGQTRKGRDLIIELYRWNGLLKRSKNGHSMKDKPVDLIAVRVRDAETKEKVFDRPLFIAACGQHKSQVSLKMVYEDYRHRYDIEPSYRFVKQKLMLDKFQTPDVEHLDNWLIIVQLAQWLLFTAANEVTHQPKKWQKYADKVDEHKPRLSIAQTRKAAQSLFLTFDPTPFLPKISNKGKGRLKGQSQVPRKRFSINRKIKERLKKHEIT